MWYGTPDVDRDTIRSVQFVATSGEFNKFADMYYDEKTDLLENLLSFKRRWLAIEQDFLHSWSLMAALIFLLKLDHLILDFSDAYSLNGRFIGLQLAWLAPRFDHGIPTRFEIVAPNPTTADDIRRVFENRNS